MIETVILGKFRFVIERIVLALLGILFDDDETEKRTSCSGPKENVL